MGGPSPFGRGQVREIFNAAAPHPTLSLEGEGAFFLVASPSNHLLYINHQSTSYERSLGRVGERERNPSASNDWFVDSGRHAPRANSSPRWGEEA